MGELSIRVVVGASDTQERVDGVAFLAASDEVADQILAAYELDDNEFERIVDRLVDAGLAELA